MPKLTRTKKKTAFVPRSFFHTLAGGAVIPVCVLGGAVSGGELGCGSATVASQCFGDSCDLTVACQGFADGGCAAPHDAGIDHQADAPTDHKDATPDAPTHADAPPDAPCNFATFVLDLIHNDTTPTALPSKDLGQSCTDAETQSAFAPLFP
jgi:hypothetical protein